MKTSMRACRFVLPMVAALFAGANVASADTFQYDGYSVTNEQNIHILTPNNISGGMGQIVLHGTGTTDAGTNLTAWCIDVYSYLFSSGTYTIGTLTNTTNLIPPPNNLSAATINAIGSLVYHGDSLISGAIPGGITDTSAAIQLAIWMTEYTNFSYSGVSQAVTDLANTYIGYLADSWSGNYDVTLYSEGTSENLSQNNQNLVFAVVGPNFPNNFTTPLPSTWTMLIAGFAGLGFLAYRGAKKNTAAFAAA